MNSRYPPAALLNTHTRLLHSAVIGEDYELSIYLPESYAASDQSYPTLYVLDAPLLFGAAVSAVTLQQYDLEAVPEMIVVGIGKQMQSMDEWWDFRWRDYTPVPLSSLPTSGGAAAFLKFIHQELIPFMDTEYRTRPDDRLIWGQSMGGLFALYALFNQPGCFHRCIATAPAFTYEGETVLDYKQALDTQPPPTEVRLFVSIGALDQWFIADVEGFIQALATKHPPNLKYRTLIVDDLAHSSAAITGFSHGIAAVYTMP